jgi:hypothetical protein
MHSKLFSLAALAVALLACVGTVNAAVVDCEVFFDGTEQDFAGSLTASGTLTSQGVGLLFGSPFVLSPNPQTDPVGLNPDTISISSDPMSLTADQSGTPETTVIGIDTASFPGDVTDISDLNIDLLNGVTQTFALDTLNLELLIFNVLPGNLDIDVSGRLKQLLFYQDPGAAVTVGDSTAGGATYAISGIARAVIDATVAVLGKSLIVISLVDQTLDTPLVLTGTVTSSVVNTTDVAASFDGSALIGAPLTLSTTLATALGSVGFTGTIDLASSINVGVSYHLECLCEGIIPEPSTIVLLGLGIVGCIPVIRRRLRK